MAWNVSAVPLSAYKRRDIFFVFQFAEAFEKNSYFIKSSLSDFQQLFISKRKKKILNQRQLTMSKVTFCLMLVVAVAYGVQAQGQPVRQTCPNTGNYSLM